MLICLLAFVGGLLTILCPCALPALPLVFARVDQPFRSSGLPLLSGMALTFAVVATAAAHGSHRVLFKATGSINSSVRKVPLKIRAFEIEFLDPGVQAFAFTFG